MFSGYFLTRRLVLIKLVGSVPEMGSMPRGEIFLLSFYDFSEAVMFALDDDALMVEGRFGVFIRLCCYYETFTATLADGVEFLSSLSPAASKSACLIGMLW